MREEPAPNLLHRQHVARRRLEIDARHADALDVGQILAHALPGPSLARQVGLESQLCGELRDDLDKLKRVLVPTPTKAHVPISLLADIKINTGPPVIKDENGMLTGWVYVDIVPEKDIGS